MKYSKTLIVLVPHFYYNFITTNIYWKFQFKNIYIYYAELSMEIFSVVIMLYSEVSSYISGVIGGIAVVAVVAVVLLLLLILATGFLWHLKRKLTRTRPSDTKIKWADIVDEVQFVVWVSECVVIKSVYWL